MNNKEIEKLAERMYKVALPNDKQPYEKLRAEAKEVWVAEAKNVIKSINEMGYVLVSKEDVEETVIAYRVQCEPPCKTCEGIVARLKKQLEDK